MDKERESCKNCRWVGCRNYGKDMPSCVKYIPETELKRKEKNI